MQLKHDKDTSLHILSIQNQTRWYFSFVNDIENNIQFVKKRITLRNAFLLQCNV